MKQYKKQTKHFIIWLNSHKDFMHIGLQWKQAKPESRADFCRSFGITLQTPVLFSLEQYIEGHGWGHKNSKWAS